MPRTEYCFVTGCDLHQRCNIKDCTHILEGAPFGAHFHECEPAATGVYVDNSGGPAAPTASMINIGAFMGTPSYKGQGDPRFFKILHEMAEIHVKKATDYGSDEDPLANLRASVNWGGPAWVGTFMRANDKIVRLQAFAKKGVLANESARDSMIDIAAYAILATILYDEESNAI